MKPCFAFLKGSCKAENCNFLHATREQISNLMELADKGAPSPKKPAPKKKAPGAPSPKRDKNKKKQISDASPATSPPGSDQEEMVYVPKKDLDRLKSQPRWCQAFLNGHCKHGDACPIPHQDPAS
eukprot:11168012-Lingulodinium_polyedra.AAC.1